VIRTFPPTAKIEGVDLVTEGIITIDRVLEYAKDHLKDNEDYFLWSSGEDGASQIARLLFEEATAGRPGHGGDQDRVDRIRRPKGAYNVIQTFQRLIEEKDLRGRIRFKSGFCMRRCVMPGVGVSLNGEHHRIAAEEARDFFEGRIIPLLKGE
jgi:hypothetical protein